MEYSGVTIIFQQFPRVVLGKSKEIILRMSVVSVQIADMEVSVSEQATPIVPVAKSANEMSGYRTCMRQLGAIQKRPPAISENVRNRIRMSPELSIYSNSAYVYAISPIAIALFWGKGGRGIAESEPLYMISTTPTHCPNTTGISNYSVRTKGRWFCEDTMLI